MAGVTGGSERVVAATDPVFAGYRSARPSLRTASLAVRIALVVLITELIVALVATAITGWALTFDPTGWTVPVGQLDVSAAVGTMVSTASAVVLGCAVVSALALVVAGGCVIVWQTRSWHNLRTLVERPGRSALAAAAVWFVPLWSLFGPKRNLDELWRSGDPGPGTIEWPAHHSLWWLLWLGANAVGVTVVIRTAGDTTIGSLLVQQLSTVLVCAGLIGAGALLLPIMQRTTARQDARYAETPAG